MQASESILAKGHALIEFLDGEGKLTRSIEVENLIVDTGLAWLAQRMVSGIAVMNYMALGTNSSPTYSYNASLYAESPGGRVGLSSVSNSGASTIYVANFGPGVGTGSVAELGIFSASAGGTMLNRIAFSPENKGPSDSVRVTWTVTLSA